MSSSTIDLHQPVLNAPAAKSSHKRLSTKQWIVVLLMVNSLSLPAMLLVIYLVEHTQYDTLAMNTLSPIAAAVIEAQIFLLAFWMAFSATPKRWRGLLAFATAFCGGLIFGSLSAVITAWQMEEVGFETAPYLLTLVFGFAIMGSVLLWLANAVFAIPAWYVSVAIDSRDTEISDGAHRRSFGVAQLLNWTGQVAIPFALLNVFVAIAEDSAASVLTIAPYFFVIAVCAPWMAVLLTPRLSATSIVMALIGTLALFSLTFAIPSKLAPHFPSWTLFSHSLTVILNLFAIRALGFCWRPKVLSTAPPHV